MRSGWAGPLRGGSPSGRGRRARPRLGAWAAKARRIRHPEIRLGRRRRPPATPGQATIRFPGGRLSPRGGITGADPRGLGGRRPGFSPVPQPPRPRPQGRDKGVPDQTDIARARRDFRGAEPSAAKAQRKQARRPPDRCHPWGKGRGRRRNGPASVRMTPPVTIWQRCPRATRQAPRISPWGSSSATHGGGHPRAPGQAYAAKEPSPMITGKRPRAPHDQAPVSRQPNPAKPIHRLRGSPAPARTAR